VRAAGWIRRGATGSNLRTTLPPQDEPGQWVRVYELTEPSEAAAERLLACARYVLAAEDIGHLTVTGQTGHAPLRHLRDAVAQYDKTHPKEKR